MGKAIWMLGILSGLMTWNAYADVALPPAEEAANQARFEAAQCARPKDLVRCTGSYKDRGRKASADHCEFYTDHPNEYEFKAGARIGAEIHQKFCRLPAADQLFKNAKCSGAGKVVSCLDGCTVFERDESYVFLASQKEGPGAVRKYCHLSKEKSARPPGK